MKQKEFDNLFKELKSFIGLDIWHIEYSITKIEQEDWTTTQAIVDKVLYDYFKASIRFEKWLLQHTKNEIIHTILHELSHIYTLNSLTLYEDEVEYFSHYIWKQAYVDFKNRFIFTNEQQTELLARRFKQLYLLID